MYRNKIQPGEGKSKFIETTGRLANQLKKRCLKWKNHRPKNLKNQSFATLDELQVDSLYKALPNLCIHLHCTCQKSRVHADPSRVS